MDEPEDGRKYTAADLMGIDALGDGALVTAVIMVCTAVDLETGVEHVYIIEDDFTPTWKAYGLLAYAKDTFLGTKQEVEDEDYRE